VWCSAPKFGQPHCYVIGVRREPSLIANCTVRYVTQTCHLGAHSLRLRPTIHVHVAPCLGMWWEGVDLLDPIESCTISFERKKHSSTPQYWAQFTVPYLAGLWKWCADALDRLSNCMLRNCILPIVLSRLAWPRGATGVTQAETLLLICSCSK
jgi:hypothetical protein